jgi:hypothetical protein
MLYLTSRGPGYDREKVYSAILSRTRNLQQLIYQGWLQWTVSVHQPFAARHPFVMTVPTRVQTGAVPLDLLHNIPSSLKHLQLRRIYGRYNHLLEVILRNENLEILNLFEIGDLESLHLENIIDQPVAQSLTILRIRYLNQHSDVDYGRIASQILPHLPKLETFAFEVCCLKDEPFFTTFYLCRNIRHFKFGYCRDVTKDGLAKISRHGKLKSLELMPLVAFDLETLRTIVNGNPNMTILLLPKESVSEEFQKELP